MPTTLQPWFALTLLLPLPDELRALTRLNDWVRWGASRFVEAGLIFGHGSDNALDEAFHLICHALHLPLDLPTAYMDAHLTPDERAAVHALLRRRLTAVNQPLTSQAPCGLQGCRLR